MTNRDSLHSSDFDSDASSWRLTSTEEGGIDGLGTEEDSDSEVEENLKGLAKKASSKNSANINSNRTNKKTRNNRIYYKIYSSSSPSSPSSNSSDSNAEDNKTVFKKKKK